jgi:NAD(P)H-hydrate epimerase
MRPVFTFNEIRAVENEIINREGIPSIILMENAGRNSFDVIADELGNLDDFNIYIICGKGNNAGDGFTLARHMLIEGIEFKIVMLTPENQLKGDAAINYDILKKLTSDYQDIIYFGSPAEVIKGFRKSERVLLIDAVLGTGISGKLDETFANAINEINNIRDKYKNVMVVSLDIPSGLKSDEDDDPVIYADFTVSMGTIKSELLFGKGKIHSGYKIEIVPIGITDEIISAYNKYNKYFVDYEDVQELLPKRKKASHKYVNGKVLVVGGSKGLSGAAAMSSLSAVKAGAGGVAAAIPESISKIFTGKLYEIMTVILNQTESGTIAADSFSKLEKRLDWCDAVLLGPGISTNEGTKKFVRQVITDCSKNMVIDADALNIIAEDVSVLKNRKYKNEIILTPHLGEFSRLSGKSIEEITADRFKYIREFAYEYKVNIVLKSETSVSCVRNGDIYINPTGNETLAMAGTGDVLSGIMVSLLAQSGDVLTAMLCGNYIHGFCADIYKTKTGNAQSASPQDIIKLIPKAITDLLEG